MPLLHKLRPRFSSALLERLTAFMKIEELGGVFMIASALLALLIVHTPLAWLYHLLFEEPLVIGYGAILFSSPFKEIVTDVLMVLFFFLVGMELKREMVAGFLAQRDRIVLPALAALGGMAVPAFVFLYFNWGHPENLPGWAVASATDIAFALCVLGLSGRNISSAAKIFLLAVAIFDDVGAVLIIAFFYTKAVVFLPIFAGCFLVFALYALHRLKVSVLWPYLAIGVGLWFCCHFGGVHTTIAGVITGLFIPFKDKKIPHHSPLDYCIKHVHPWVTFFVLPLFSFASAGIDLSHFDLNHVFSPLPLSVILGLLFGKPLGILIISFLLIHFNLAKLPQGTTKMEFLGISILAGIGFTMSFFIGVLAFPSQELQDHVKLGVLLGSFLSGFLGVIILKLSQKKKKTGVS